MKFSSSREPDAISKSRGLLSGGGADYHVSEGAAFCISRTTLNEKVVIPKKGKRQNRRRSAEGPLLPPSRVQPGLRPLFVRRQIGNLFARRRARVELAKMGNRLVGQRVRERKNALLLCFGRVRIICLMFWSGGGGGGCRQKMARCGRRKGPTFCGTLSTQML